MDAENLDWLSESAGKDIELHVNMPEPDAAELAKMKKAESSNKQKKVPVCAPDTNAVFDKRML